MNRVDRRQLGRRDPVARSIAGDVRAVLISDEPEAAAAIKDRGSGSCRPCPW